MVYLSVCPCVRSTSGRPPHNPLIAIVFMMAERQGARLETQEIRSGRTRAHKPFESSKWHNYKNERDSPLAGERVAAA